MTTLIIITLIVCVSLVIYYWLRKPFIHKHNSVKEFRKNFEFFYRNSVDGSQMFIDAEFSEAFIQSGIVSTANGKKVIIDFPLAEWSKEIYPIVYKICNEGNVSLIEKNLDNTVGAKALILDFGSDFVNASFIASQIAEAILNENNEHKKNGKFSIQFKGMPA